MCVWYFDNNSASNVWINLRVRHTLKDFMEYQEDGYLERCGRIVKFYKTRLSLEFC